MRLAHGKPTRLGSVRGAMNYYGPYDWRRLFAVAP
jgi:hypothetical protein